MARKKTQEQYEHDLYNKNPDIKVIGEYTGASNKIKVMCNKCQYTWETRAVDLLRGHGCPECSGNRHYTHDEFVGIVASRVPTVEVVGTYKNTLTKIKKRCKICGYEWSSLAGNLLHGEGCPKCAYKLSRTTEEFIKEVSDINPDVVILGEYLGRTRSVPTRCNKCGYVWEPTADRLLSGYGCPHCKTSNGEKRIIRYLKAANIEYVPQYKFDDCRNVIPLPFDFMIPSFNMLIEYDGEQHYRPVTFGGISESRAQEIYERTVLCDRIKDTYCKNHKIMLLRIPYTEYDNIESILDKHFV